MPVPISDDPMHIDNVRARRAADGAEREMYREIASEIDGPPPPGIGTLLKRALTSSRPNSAASACDGCGHLADEHGSGGCDAHLEMSHSSRQCPCRLTSRQVATVTTPYSTDSKGAEHA